MSFIFLNCLNDFYTSSNMISPVFIFFQHVGFFIWRSKSAQCIFKILFPFISTVGSLFNRVTTSHSSNLERTWTLTTHPFSLSVWGWKMILLLVEELSSPAGAQPLLVSNDNYDDNNNVYCSRTIHQFLLLS